MLRDPDSELRRGSLYIRTITSLLLTQKARCDDLFARGVELRVQFSTDAPQDAEARRLSLRVCLPAEGELELRAIVRVSCDPRIELVAQHHWYVQDLPEVDVEWPSGRAEGKACFAVPLKEKAFALASGIRQGHWPLLLVRLVACAIPEGGGNLQAKHVHLGIVELCRLAAGAHPSEDRSSVCAMSHAGLPIDVQEPDLSVPPPVVTFT
mmetsp:Transcript_104973/g.262928  ORF Transcript_104973/g.262928 Transcript_104973/m.262928 type:complete len:209 (-) Transcript_104973:617-1243(-)